MTLGEQIKKQRQERDLSQPELAELAGIEQSYLSKLENDKSIPSNDIFRRILKALNIELDNFLAQFDQQIIESTLSQISDVEVWLKQKSQSDFNTRRQYLLVSSALVVIAITLFFVGYSKLLFSESSYVYRSQGIVLKGEPKDIFDNWLKLLPRSGSHELRENKRLEIEKRKDVDFITSDTKVGEFISKQVEQGERHYQFFRIESVRQPINGWLQVIAVFLFSCGIMGFVLERKLFNRI